MNKKMIVLAMSLIMLAANSGCGKTDADLQESSESATSMITSQTEASVTESTTEISDATTEAEKSTEESVVKTTEAKTDNVDFISIDGDWYIDGEYDAAHISISSSGNFTAYYANGNIENTGYIKHEAKEKDGVVIYWYMLYTNDDKPYIGFIDDGSERKLDFYVVTGTPVHYVWTSGVGGIADDGRGDEISAEENYVGTWGCGRATLNISGNDDGTYLGKITWSDSAFAYVEWIYPLTYDEESQSMVCDGNAVKTYYECRSEDSEPDATVMYTGGSGSFYEENGVITWYDAEENIGEDMQFVK